MRQLIAIVVVAVACSHPPPPTPPRPTCAQYVEHDLASRAVFHEAWMKWQLGDQVAADRLLRYSIDEAVTHVRPPPRPTRGRPERDYAFECVIALFASETTISPSDVVTRLSSIAGKAYTAAILLELAHRYEASGRHEDAKVAAFLAYANAPR